MFCNIQKTEYEFSGIRILSRLKLNKGKLQKSWWIEIHSYEKNRWEKLRNIELIPKGAVVKSLYEYGNGDLVPPFWNRVEEKMAKIQNEYSVVNYSDTSNRASYFNHHRIQAERKDLFLSEVLRDVHKRISSGCSGPTVFCFFTFGLANVSLPEEC